MGMSTSACLFFGIDLGSNEDYPMNYEITNEELESLFEEDRDIVLEDLISEYAGWTEVLIPWNSTDMVERNEQRARRDRLLKGIGIGYGSYGYDFRGTYLSAGDIAYTYDECAPVVFNKHSGDLEDSDFGSRPKAEHVESLMLFIEFLDAKGFVIGNEFRSPRWRLAASYG